MKSSIFWDITPCSPLSQPTFRRNISPPSSTCHLLSRWFLAHLMFSTLKMEAICSSETPVDFQRTTRRYIPEDGTLQSKFCVQTKIKATKARHRSVPPGRCWDSTSDLGRNDFGSTSFPVYYPHHSTLYSELQILQMTINK
jgi:hypothetical protein